MRTVEEAVRIISRGKPRLRYRSIRGPRQKGRSGAARWPGALIGTAALLAAMPASAQTAAATPGQNQVGALWSRNTLLGGIGGLRPFLKKYGISLGLSETDELWGNVSGGFHQGSKYDGMTLMTLALDTGKAFGWAGGTFFASGLQIHGRQISAENLGLLQPVSGIEASRASRLWELWYDQKFLGGRADLKLGQESIDGEFIVSQYALTFLNTMMGWPLVPSVDLYAGGPAYPLSSLGVRLRVRPTEAATLLAGVFDDNPPGGPFNNDSQLRDGEASGTLFSFGTGALWIGEVQYAVNSSPSKRCNSVFCGLSGTYKLGAWFDIGDFPDQRFASDGLSLANPLSNGIPRMDRSNWSFYAVADQTVWRAGPNSPRTVNVFLRPMGAPGDRNLVSFSLNAGVTLAAPFASRPNDTVGIGFGFGHVGGASGLDRDAAFFTGAPYPIRSNESFIEVTYQARIASWWGVQPDFQYFFRPGGGIPNPDNPSERIGNEAVFGLRTVIAF